MTSICCTAGAAVAAGKRRKQQRSHPCPNLHPFVLLFALFAYCIISCRKMCYKVVTFLQYFPVYFSETD